MKKEWSLSNDKAIINFSVNYCESEDKVLNSEGFRSVLEHFFKNKKDDYSRISLFIKKYIPTSDVNERIAELTKIFKLLTIMNSQELAKAFPEYAFVCEERTEFRHFVEEIYKFWRSLERYALIMEAKGTEGLVSTSFIDAKRTFDQLLLGLYRKISNNISLKSPNVYRQVPAGSNAGIITDEILWPVPSGYEILKGIPFITNIVLESPFITYPKKNKRGGCFTEISYNPILTTEINPEHFFVYPAKVGNLLAYVYVHRDFLTHGVSLANLFELASEGEFSGKKPDILLLFGAKDHGSDPVDVFYDDTENHIMVGYISHHETFDYFGYMKKMILTLHNVTQIKRGVLPIHGAMVHIVLKDGQSANVVIMGDSGAGKSESIEAFRNLAEEFISDMTIIFDDMGSFKIDEQSNSIWGYGTEIGAFIRLDDLETGYAFKELDRSVFMNPDKINARLITPVSTFEEITQGLKVDLLLYANNYTRIEEGESAISFFDTVEEAIDVFVAGKRMSKGTTTESGITTSYFANPFGPLQKQEACDVLIHKYFQFLFDQGIKVGEMKTQLGISDFERTGPSIAARNLFDLIKEMNPKK